jgi:hypothetical protein
MNRTHIRKRVICATAAALLTGVTFSLFVAAKPQNYENRDAARATRVAAHVVVSVGAPSHAPSGTQSRFAG